MQLVPLTLSWKSPGQAEIWKLKHRKGWNILRAMEDDVDECFVNGFFFVQGAPGLLKENREAVAEIAQFPSS